MRRNRQYRNERRVFAIAAIGSILALVLGATARATPHVFLSPEVTSIVPTESVEIEVFIEDVTDLKVYEIVLEVTGGDSGSLDLTALEIDEGRTDFVFAGMSPLVCLPDLGNLRITCSPLSDDCVSVTTPPAYLGKYTFTASADAHGTFDVKIVEEPMSFLLDCDGGDITPFDVTNSTVGIGIPIPAVSDWGIVVMALLVLTAGTLVFVRRRQSSCIVA